MNIADQKIQINKKGCACAISLELLGDKWTILVVRDLFRGKTTFTEFAYHTDEGIATNILSNRLKKLLELGIISFRLKSSDKKVKEYYESLKTYYTTTKTEPVVCIENPFQKFEYETPEIKNDIKIIKLG